MEFALSEEQRLFADSLRGLLADRVPIEALRHHAEAGNGFDAGLWEALIELGLPGLLVPERFGGAGLGVQLEQPLPGGPIDASVRMHRRDDRDLGP